MRDDDIVRRSLVLVLCCAASISRAQPAPTEGAMLFEEGRTLVKQGRWADAFDRFTRSEGSEKVVQGAGLGLSIAQSFARAQGGDLIYRSVQPSGARFELVLPPVN